MIAIVNMRCSKADFLPGMPGLGCQIMGHISSDCDCVKLILLLKCYRYNWSHKCLLGFGLMHWPNNQIEESHCAKLWKLRKMAVFCGKRLTDWLTNCVDPIEMCTTICYILSENHMWLLLSSYLCMEVNAVMPCPNYVVKLCWSNKALDRQFQWGPSSPQWGGASSSQ